MEKKSYHEKLKDPRWQKKRLEILERDKWKCMACGVTDKTLHVHHIFYFPSKEPWEIHNGFLITFCEDCHKGGGCEGIACRECKDFGVDCDGCSDNSQDIIGVIGSLLNIIWKTDKRGDYFTAIGMVFSTIPPGE